MFHYDLPAPSTRARELQDRMLAFMRDEVLPAEAAYIDEHGDAGAAEVVRRFLESGEEHLCLRKRKPVV